MKYLMFILLTAITISSAEDILEVSTFEISPWGIKEGKISKGITYDMAQAIAKEAGLKIKNNIVPFARFLHYVKTGKSDLAIMHRVKASEAIAFPLGRTMVDPEIIVFPRKEVKIKSINDLSKLAVGIPRSSLNILAEKISRSDIGNLVELKDDSQAIRMLNLSRLDCIITSKEALFFLLNKRNIPATNFGAPLTLSVKEGNIMFSKKSKKQHLKARIKKAVTSLRKKGTFIEIRKKYLGY